MFLLRGDLKSWHSIVQRYIYIAALQWLHLAFFARVHIFTILEYSFAEILRFPYKPAHKGCIQDVFAMAKAFVSVPF